MAVHGDDFECLSDEDGLNHIDSLIEPRNTAKDMETLGLEGPEAMRLLVLDREFPVETESNWTVLGD